MKDQEAWLVDALCRACARGDLVHVKLLLKVGAPLNKRCLQGEFPIIKAIYSGSEDLVKFLVKNGVDVNVKSESGKTALYLSAIQGHEKIVNILIHAKAELY